ncbi:MAG: pilus assembly protein [Chloroflexi bacterium]|nr:pilus assembly protein [Chloroflexota bacterium]
MRRGFRLRGERGATLVEYALVLLVFLTLVFGIMEFGRVIFLYSALTNAAREGARYGIVPPHNAAAAAARAQEYARDAGLDSATIVVSFSGDTVTVRADYTADLLTGLFGASIPLQAESTMWLE